VDRSLAALARQYKAKEALGTLTPAERSDRDACTAFRESLPPSRRSWSLIALGVVVFVVTPFAARLASVWLDFQGRALSYMLETNAWVYSPDHPIRQELVLARSERESVEQALRNIGRSLGSPASSLGDVVSSTTELTAVQVFVLLFAILTMLYLVFRVAVPVFRLKRMMLNLGGRRDVPDGRAASSWHVNKSVGVYDLERKAFDRLGARPPTEFPVDLAILAIPPVLFVPMVQLALSVADRDVYFGYPFLYASVISVLITTRWGWLLQAWRGRCSGGSSRRPPRAVPLPHGSLVETRSPAETMGWCLLVMTIAPAGLFQIALVPVWYRLAATARSLRQLAQAQPDARPRWRRHPAWSSIAFASDVGTPLVMPVHVWRLASLEPRNRRRRTRVLAAVLGSVACLARYPNIFVSPFMPDRYFHTMVTVDRVGNFAYLIVIPLLMLLVQVTQNRLIDAPLSSGAPLGAMSSVVIAD
jgi:hypothetical protein